MFYLLKQELSTLKLATLRPEADLFQAKELLVVFQRLRFY